MRYVSKFYREILLTPDGVQPGREKEVEIQWTPDLVLAALPDGSLTSDGTCLWVSNKH